MFAWFSLQHFWYQFQHCLCLKLARLRTCASNFVIMVCSRCPSRPIDESHPLLPGPPSSMARSGACELASWVLCKPRHPSRCRTTGSGSGIIISGLSLSSPSFSSSLRQNCIHPGRKNSKHALGFQISMACQAFEKRNSGSPGTATWVHIQIAPPTNFNLKTPESLVTQAFRRWYLHPCVLVG